ncbi:uncharacterized protein [Lolium perenne]|uniref:uncharacterized protein n=1 Tax=Lolium perenne TaxID=4522 RepID=UPI0021F614AC|nr:uncharacterized protein LOC127320867 [Lolium perenne]
MRDDGSRASPLRPSSAPIKGAGHLPIRRRRPRRLLRIYKEQSHRRGVRSSPTQAKERGGGRILSMEPSGDVSPPKPRRKVRRSALKDRERGMEVIARGRRFVLPSDAKLAGPVVYWLNRMSVDVYNCSADLMETKNNLKAAMAGAEETDKAVLKLVITFINKQIRELRKQGFRLRRYVLDVEQGVCVNEPLDWVRP